MPQRRFVINEPTTAYETFGEEAIAINLAQGTYYSLADRAKALLEAVVDVDDADALLAALEAKDAVAGQLSRRALDELVAQDILRQDSAAADRNGDVHEMVANIIAAKPSYDVLSHNDLADIIAADPVHDFDASTGLPSRNG